MSAETLGSLGLMVSGRSPIQRLNAPHGLSGRPLIDIADDFKLQSVPLKGCRRVPLKVSISLYGFYRGFRGLGFGV